MVLVFDIIHPQNKAAASDVENLLHEMAEILD